MAEGTEPEIATLGPWTGILAEIAGVAGDMAALKLARERGGQCVYFPPCPAYDHWLSVLVGYEAAQAICRAVTAGVGLSLPVPLGPMASQRRRWSQIAQALAAGATGNDVARQLGIDSRTVRRHRNGHSGLGRLRDPNQGELF